MKKKQYLTPQIQPVECRIDQHLLTMSTEGFTLGEVSYENTDEETYWE